MVWQLNCLAAHEITVRVNGVVVRRAGFPFMGSRLIYSFVNQYTPCTDFDVAHTNGLPSRLGHNLLYYFWLLFD